MGPGDFPPLFSLPAVEKAQLEKSPIIHTFSRSKLFTEVSLASQWGVDSYLVSQPQEPSIKKEAQGWVAHTSGPFPCEPAPCPNVRSQPFFIPSKVSTELRAGSFPSPKVNILMIHSATLITDSSAVSHRRLHGQPRRKPPVFLMHDVPVSLAPRADFRFPHQRLKHISGYCSSTRSLHAHPFYKIEPLIFAQWVHHTQVERAGGGQPCICVFNSAWFSPWLLLASLQNEPPPPPPATPTWRSWALRTRVPPVKADFMVCNSFCSLSWLSLPRGACSPIMCKDNQSALLFFYLPNQKNVCSSLWNTTNGILELIFRHVEVFQTKIDARHR